jgi:uncharacterized protein YjiS (DUF1127 family)
MSGAKTRETIETICPLQRNTGEMNGFHLCLVGGDQPTPPAHSFDTYKRNNDMNTHQRVNSTSLVVPFHGLVNPATPVAEGICIAFEHISSIISDFFAARQARRRVNTIVTTLVALDDRMLRDIGVYRGEISEVAHRVVYEGGTLRRSTD